MWRRSPHLLRVTAPGVCSARGSARPSRRGPWVMHCRCSVPSPHGAATLGRERGDACECRPRCGEAQGLGGAWCNVGRGETSYTILGGYLPGRLSSVCLGEAPAASGRIHAEDRWRGWFCGPLAGATPSLIPRLLFFDRSLPPPRPLLRSRLPRGGALSLRRVPPVP